jgi:hypothetical protein
VFGAFFGLLVDGAFFIPPRTNLAEYLAYVAFPCAGLVGICWLKGEASRWRLR